MQLIFDTETDDLTAVVATLSAAYGRTVSIDGTSSSTPVRRTRSTGRRGGRRRHDNNGRPSSADVRAWAAEQGLKVGTHGRLPASLWEQYAASTASAE